jgi:hypothetical protein
VLVASCAVRPGPRRSADCGRGAVRARARARCAWGPGGQPGVWGGGDGLLTLGFERGVVRMLLGLNYMGCLAKMN